MFANKPKEAKIRCEECKKSLLLYCSLRDVAPELMRMPRSEVALEWNFPNKLVLRRLLQ